MIKILLIAVLVLIVVCSVLLVIVKLQKDKNKAMQATVDDYKNTCFELNCKIEKLRKEMEIEKKHNEKLAKKLVAVSCMSIDDVLHELQNNKNG